MTGKSSYELIDHTADFGMQVYASSVKDLFQHAALALMDQLLEAAKPCEQQTQQLSVAGSDWPDLMVNWLREILFLWDGNERLVRSVQIENIVHNKLDAQVQTEAFSPQHHVIKTEIKAVTYHQIQVVDRGHQWEAKIIFDI